jgi:hypothetical protein
MAGVGQHGRERTSFEVDPRQVEHGVRPRPFDIGCSMNDTASEQLAFLATELLRFEACGAWERTHISRYVSQMFVVPRPTSTSGV